MNSASSLNLSPAPNSPFDLAAAVKLLREMDSDLALLQDVPAGPAADRVEDSGETLPVVRGLLDGLGAKYPHSAVSLPVHGRVCMILSVFPLERIAVGPSAAPASDAEGDSRSEGETTASPSVFTGPVVCATAQIAGKTVALASASWVPLGPEGSPAVDPTAASLAEARVAAARALEDLLIRYGKGHILFTTSRGAEEAERPAGADAAPGASGASGVSKAPEPPAYTLAGASLWGELPRDTLCRLPAYVKDGVGSTYPLPKPTVEADFALGTPEPRLLVCRHYAERRACGSGSGHAALRLDYVLK